MRSRNCNCPPVYGIRLRKYFTSPVAAIFRSSDLNEKIETWIARTFSPNAFLTSMGSSQERAELEAKLARCRDLAREFREGPTADMIAIWRLKSAKAYKDWRTRQILPIPLMTSKTDPCRVMEWTTGACDEGNATSTARARLRPRARVFRITGRAAERREAQRPDHKNVPSQLVISGGLGGGSP